MDQTKSRKEIKQRCTRCKVVLKGGVNIKKTWTMPICYLCRVNIMARDKARLFNLTVSEKKIMLKRLTKQIKGG